MELDFSKITVNELLEALGKGGHKPGSGSAAALQGMISAKLAQTVIAISSRKKYYETYKSVLPKLSEMSADIENNILPKLADFFQQDAYYFDKAIKARTATLKAEAASDFYEASRLRKKEADELKMSVRIPLEIAELCVNLARISLYVFNNAFKSARGDSHVALGGAIASLAGCLSIVQLNFLSFKINHFYWTKEMSEWYNDLKREYEKLKGEVDNCVIILEGEVSGRMALYSDTNNFLEKYKVDKEWTENEIEKLASEFQNLLWNHHKSIWGTYLTSPRQIIHPQTIFEEVFDYDFGEFPHLDNDDEFAECAGYIDQRERHIVLSNKYSSEVRNFTAAHELGHALLHNQTVLHRDIPLDGSNPGPRSITEKQADKFATFFLMPKRQLLKTFSELFNTRKLLINDNTAFNLIRGSESDLRSKIKNRRDFALKIASADIYAGHPFKSLAQQYNVSVIAMAIRLEELDLV
ncbi:cyclodeaminase/cyclohydrolase family protein [Flavobacterium yafengii]|uniref:cyclodeaminase/cyclohydrolase family protein n=1 Tax=Flavobacterium yafengii TaxID=3041253 RepID=UPI0024A969E1|nr:cyclodeaminase/cyclohydrolase family protein [Flavobacterium yafengii]MDI5888589.1 cyclodeaminase/cyclohydrolase family protein [Flavobacterium yafengii]